MFRSEELYLPDELILKIASYLTDYDIIRLSNIFQHIKFTLDYYYLPNSLLLRGGHLIFIK
jgi:hypothetical protein